MKLFRLYTAMAFILCTFIAPPTASAASSIQLITGERHTCMLNPDGTVQCWGDGGYGQLGDGNFTDRTEPVDVENLTGVISLAAGSTATCAVTDSGTVYCWGLNDLGQLGDGTFDDSAVPVQVSGITNAVSVSLEEDHACALLSDQTVTCWGDNEFLQLGNDVADLSTTPVPVANLEGVAAVSVGWLHTCALLTTGAVECWGFGGNGQFGNGDSNYLTDMNLMFSPEPIPSLITSGAVAIESGWFQTCALLDTGKVSCWGTGTGIGLSPTTAQVTPIEISNLSSVRSLSVSQDHHCAVTTSDEVYCWGETYRVVLGNWTAYDVLSPLKKLGLNATSTIATGGLHSCAVLTYGNAQCWGTGSSGQLGNGLANQSEWPVGVDAITTVARVPSSPLKLTAGAIRAGAVEFSWEKPDSYGLTVLEYEITLQDGQAQRTFYTTADETIIVSDLTAGTYYAGRVRARTAAGWGDISAFVDNRTASLPLPPNSITAAMGGFGEIVVSFTPRATDSLMPDKHRIEWKSLTTDLGSSAETATTSYTITGLTPSDSYLITVYAHSAVGWSTGGSSNFGTAGGIPKKVINLAASSVTPNSATITWQPDPTDYRPALEYQVTYSAPRVQPKSIRTTSTSMTLSQLSPQTTYSVYVEVRSELGWGQFSDAITFTTGKVAGPPWKVSKVTGTASPKKLVVKWTAPNDGGSRITNYAVRYRLTGSIKFSAWFNAGLKTTFTIKNLKKGKFYDIQVRTKNSVGTSEGLVFKIKQSK